MNETLGVLGGMGPVAAVNFQSVLHESTPVEVEQDHIPTIVHNDASLPPRVPSILGETDPVLPSILSNARELDSLPVDYIVVPSNTNHHFFDDINKEVDADMINMIHAVREYCEREEYDSVVVLCTTACKACNIYDNAFEHSNVEVKYPSSLEDSMNSIYSFKNGEFDNAKKYLNNAINNVEHTADAVILGCTELSCLSPSTNTPVVDSTQQLAEKCVELICDSQHY